MKVQATYKGKTVEIDIPDEKLEELVKEQKKTGWEKPVWGQTYWFIDELGEVEGKDWKDDELDEKRYACGNCFTSKELAENIARYTSLDRRIRRRIAEICEPVIRGIEWRYNIEYNYEDEHCIVQSSAKFAPSHWYCDTRAHAEQIINEFREELMWYFTEFKDRMDG